MAILPTKLMSATFLPKISFVIIVGKRDIRKLFISQSSSNGSNFDYQAKICQHLSLPLSQKSRHLNLPLKLSPPRVIRIRMIRRSTMLTKGRCFKPMPLKCKFCKNELKSLKAQLANLKVKSSELANHAQPVQGSRSWEGPPRSFFGISHDAMVWEYVISSAHNSNLTPKFSTSFYPS
jgi:hypothetical protein